jgi:hypothetical protein
MANPNPGGETTALCPEDLRVGQQFVSSTHRIDQGTHRAPSRSSDLFDRFRALDEDAVGARPGVGFAAADRFIDAQRRERFSSGQDEEIVG